MLCWKIPWDTLNQYYELGVIKIVLQRYNKCYSETNWKIQHSA